MILLNSLSCIQFEKHLKDKVIFKVLVYSAWFMSTRIIACLSQIRKSLFSWCHWTIERVRVWVRVNGHVNTWGR